MKRGKETRVILSVLLLNLGLFLGLQLYLLLHPLQPPSCSMRKGGPPPGLKDGRGQKVLVTGAAGFIGSHVARYCAEELGMFVVGVDDLSGGFTTNIPDSIEFLKGDLRDPEFVDMVFRIHGPFVHVYHLAAYAAEGLSHFVRVYNYETNLVASARLLNHAVLGGTKTFVFTSSIAVYGSGSTGEDARPTPEDPYGISKLAFEMDLRAAHELFGIDFVIMRPHNVYGPGQNIFDRYRNVVGIFMRQVLGGEPMTIFGDGTQTRAFSFVGDVAPFIAASPLVEGARNQIFNVGSNEVVSLNEVALRVSHALGKPPRVEHLPPRHEVKHVEADHSKLKRTTGKMEVQDSKRVRFEYEEEAQQEQGWDRVLEIDVVTGDLSPTSVEAEAQCLRARIVLHNVAALEYQKQLVAVEKAQRDFLHSGVGERWEMVNKIYAEAIVRVQNAGSVLVGDVRSRIRECAGEEELKQLKNGMDVYFSAVEDLRQAEHEKKATEVCAMDVRRMERVNAEMRLAAQQIKRGYDEIQRVMARECVALEGGAGEEVQRFLVRCHKNKQELAEKRREETLQKMRDGFDLEAVNGDLIIKVEIPKEDFSPGESFAWLRDALQAEYDEFNVEYSDKDVCQYDQQGKFLYRTSVQALQFTLKNPPSTETWTRSGSIGLSDKS